MLVTEIIAAILDPLEKIAENATKDVTWTITWELTGNAIQNTTWATSSAGNDLAFKLGRRKNVETW